MGADERAKVLVTKEFPVSADKLWAVLGDFTNLSWVPAVHHVEFEGEGPGMVRRMYIDASSPAVLERLEARDEATRTLSYSIPENNPLPTIDYQATMHVIESGPDSCTLEWSCDFEPDSMPKDQAVMAVEGFYQMLLPGIAEVVE